MKNYSLICILTLNFFVYGCSNILVSKENIHKFQGKTVNKFVIKPTEGKHDLVLHFDFDKSSINAKDRLQLDKFISSVDGRLGVIAITGHTDLIGTRTYNNNLSVRRKNQVMRYLKQNDKTPIYHQFTTFAFGKDHPLFSTITKFNNAANRRVVVSFNPL